MSNVCAVGLAALSVIIASLSQILLKKSAKLRYEKIIREYLNIYVIVAYFMFGISTLLTIKALTILSIQDTAMIEGISYILIMISDQLFFKEKISKGKVVGNIFILFGILLFYV